MTASANDANRKRLFRALRVVVTVALLYWVLRQVGIRQVVDTLGDANLRLLGLALVLFQGGVFLRATRWWVLLHGSGVNASPRQVLELQYISQFFNVSLPTGFAGDIVRTFEFQGGDSKAGTAGIVVLDRTLGFSTLFGIALISLALGHRLLDPATTLVLAAVSLAGLVAVVVVLQSNLVRRLTRFLPQRFSLEGDGMLARLYGALTGCSPSYLALAIAVSAVSTVLTIVVHYVIGRSVGIEVGIGVFFIVTPIVSISLLVPTIGGLGLRELGYQFLLAQLGVPGGVAVALGFGVYIARLSAGVLGGLYNLLWASRR